MRDYKFGNYITALRRKCGYTQYELGKLVGVSDKAVSKWENDVSSPDVMNLIKLADLLDTDVEYLATGRRTYGRRPPIVIKTTETIEKIVEKPVVQRIETVVEHIVEKPVVKTVEKPVIKKVYRNKYVRNTGEFLFVGGLSFCAGLLIGLFL